MNFNRIDVSNSSYYGFDKGRFVVARNTRYGQERAFGTPSERLIPLPERLYAGGPTSLRGFPQNAAGPRDPETGYPIGGAGALANSTELRLPPPLCPGWATPSASCSFTIWATSLPTPPMRGQAPFARASQTAIPARCSLSPISPICSPGPVSSTGWQGQCNFNYFSHALGTGLRYHTPAGPIRFDFSYNLNTPIYPVIYNYSLTHPASAPLRGRGQPLQLLLQPGTDLLMSSRLPIRPKIAHGIACPWIARAVCLWHGPAQNAQHGGSGPRGRCGQQPRHSGQRY